MKTCTRSRCLVGNDIPQALDQFQGPRGETDWCLTCREYDRRDARRLRRQAKLAERYAPGQPQPITLAPNQRWLTPWEAMRVGCRLCQPESGGLPLMGSETKVIVKDRPDLRPGEVNFCVR